MSTELMHNPHPTAGASRPVVLVVDDDPDYLETTCAQLAAAGYDVRTAPTAAEARKLLAAGSFDAVVADLMLEEPDGGFALCYAIKKRSPATPVVIVSAVASETGLDFDATSSAEKSWIKADALLAKPLRFEQLQQTLGRLLHKE